VTYSNKPSGLWIDSTQSAPKRQQPSAVREDRIGRFD